MSEFPLRFFFFFLKHSSPKYPDISTRTASWRKKSWGGRWGTTGAWANLGLVGVPAAIRDERPCSPAGLLLLGDHVCQESLHKIRFHLSKVSCREWRQGTGERQGLQYVHGISDRSFSRVPQLTPSSKLGPLLSTSNSCSTQGFGPPEGGFLSPSDHSLSPQRSQSCRSFCYTSSPEPAH